MEFHDDINIVIAGEAGQGIETAAEVISKILHINGYNVFSIPEYMSRIRGGCNSSLVKVGREKSPCFSRSIDVLFALDSKVFEHLKTRITDDTISFDLKKKNFYVVGYVMANFELDLDECLGVIANKFEKYNSEKNIADLKEGFEDGKKNTHYEIKIPAVKEDFDNLFLSANDALGIGCIAGGCNFLPFYPMSPSTFLQSFITQYAEEFEIVSKQVEDEICVMNMALGAWYSGARALACTSGGGFDLMCEGVSLAGITESPIVINIAQRPGPATGLPTRTEQGDLNLALYSGHGEFPRIIYAPATLEDAFFIGQISFDMADKFQVPVFILTDQSLLESTYSTKKFEPVNIHSHIVKSDSNYKRYQLAETSLSPRAIPNFGEGVVCVDSDEHDEYGYITEDFDIREAMVKKRMNKFELIETQVLEPYFFGGENYKSLIISWGSNFNVIKESIKDKKDFALLHFIQVYPVHKVILDYVNKAEKLIIIEQNSVGQFEKLIKREFGIIVHERFNKFSGEPSSVEEIKAFLEKINEI